MWRAAGLVFVVVLLLAGLIFSLSSPVTVASPTNPLPGIPSPRANSCAGVNQIPRSECDALAAFHAATHGSAWPRGTGWFETNQPCTWQGLTCDAGHVTRIDLPMSQLRGIIPPELGNLARLESLDLSSNMLSGSLPHELSKLESLQYLDVSSNQLTGPLPIELVGLRHLSSVVIDHNALTGPIPAGLAPLIKPIAPARQASQRLASCITSATTARPKVLILTYNPYLPSLGKTVFAYESSYDPSVTSQQLSDDFCAASGGYVDPEIVGRIDRAEFPLETNGQRLSEAEYLSLRSKGLGYAQTHGGAMVDIQFTMVDNGVATVVKSGQVDEVWMFGSWTMSLYEAYMGGPGAFWVNGPTFPSESGRAYVVMGFENAVGVPNSLHSVGHRVESTLDRAYGLAGGGEITPWARFRKYINSPWLPNAPLAVGDIHHPVNTDHDYDYTNQTTVQSTADDWLNFPNLTGALKPVNAQTWGNSDLGYYLWWYGHLPKADGVSPRSDSAPQDLRQNNWWKYIFQFNDYPELVPPRLPTATPAPTFTPTPLPGCPGCVIGQFHATSALLQALGAPFQGAGRQPIILDGRMYVFGGKNDANSRVTSVFTSLVQRDGALSPWTQTNALPGAYYDHSEALIGNRVYMVTGAAGATDVFYATVHPDGSIDAWHGTTALNPSRQNFAVAAYGSYLYASGGNAGGTRDFVFFAHAAEDGSLGEWLTTTALPVAMEGHTMLAQKGRLYVFAPSGSVYFAPVNSDGTVGAWSITMSLPLTISQYTAFAYDGIVYLLGGGGTAVYQAPIQPDGSLDRWHMAGGLPAARSASWGGAVGCHLYVVAGHDASGYQDSVFYAPLQAASSTMLHLYLPIILDR